MQIFHFFVGIFVAALLRPDISASISGPDLLRQIRSLSPSYRTIYQVDNCCEIIGLDLVNNHGEPPSILVRGQDYTWTLYTKYLDSYQTGFDWMIEIGGVVIGRSRVAYQAHKIGETIKYQAKMRVPGNVQAGSVSMRVLLVDPKNPGFILTLNIASVLIAFPSNFQQVHGGIPADSDTSNLVQNGSFEQGLQGWQISSLQNYMVSIDSAVSYDGQCSLRLDFGGGLDYSYYNPAQDIKVASNSRYSLSYYIKTDHITSEMGPEMEILGGLYTTTGGVTGTQDWTLRTREFITPKIVPESLIGITIRFRRFGGDGTGANPYYLSPYGPIGGTAWIDRITLMKLR